MKRINLLLSWLLQVAGWGADGVIIGSAIVKLLGEAKSPEEGLKELEAFVKSLKSALVWIKQLEIGQVEILRRTCKILNLFWLETEIRKDCHLIFFVWVRVALTSISIIFFIPFKFVNYSHIIPFPLTWAKCIVTYLLHSTNQVCNNTYSLIAELY